MDKNEKIVLKCLDEMYRKSEPPTTMKELLKKYGGKKDNSYLKKHKIKIKDYDRIKKKYQKMLPKYLHRSLDMELLNLSPAIKEDEKNDKKTQ